MVYKMKRQIALTICVFVLAACNRIQDSASDNPLSCQIAVRYILDNKDNNESIVPWTDDSIKTIYPELVMLIDPLYQFQPTDTLEKDLVFMSEMRKRFCEYYDSVGIWKKSDDEYAKADTVIDHIKNIYNNSATSSADMMIASDIGYRIERLRHYGLFQQFIGHRNAAYYHLQEAEWMAWDTLKKTVSTIVTSLVDISYANASGWSTGMIRTNNLSRIANAHMSLYERDGTLYSFFDSSDGYTIVGSYQKPAKQFLISCCQEALNNVLSNEDVKITKEDRKQIEKAISDLPVLIDNWLNARNAWTGEICYDATRDMFTFSTAQMLIDLGTVISTGI